MRAVQITRFGGPEVLDVVDVPEPEPARGQRLHDVSRPACHPAGAGTAGTALSPILPTVVGHIAIRYRREVFDSQEGPVPAVVARPRGRRPA